MDKFPIEVKWYYNEYANYTEKMFNIIRKSLYGSRFGEKSLGKCYHANISFSDVPRNQFGEIELFDSYKRGKTNAIVFEYKFDDVNNTGLYDKLIITQEIGHTIDMFNVLFLNTETNKVSQSPFIPYEVNELFRAIYNSYTRFNGIGKKAMDKYLKELEEKRKA